MKLCPQCEFIYEDDQSICDMDGKELVNDSSPLVFAEAPPSQQNQEQARMSVSLVARPQPAPSELMHYSRPSRSFAVAAVIGVVLIALLLAVYYGRVKAHSVADQSLDPATSAIQADAPAADVIAITASSQLPEQISSASPSAVTLPAGESESRPRPAADLVSARSSNGNTNSSAIIWLRNGSSIKADEVWEKRDGVWYRQSGLVTFLKRSQVSRIQRLDSPQYSKSAPTKRATEPARKRPVANADTANVRKESRVGSFLKKTGRILSKPFKL